MSWLNKNCNLGATPHFQADPNRMNLTIYNYIFIVIYISIIIYIYIYYYYYCYHYCYHYYCYYCYYLYIYIYLPLSIPWNLMKFLFNPIKTDLSCPEARNPHGKWRKKIATSQWRRMSSMGPRSPSWARHTPSIINLAIWNGILVNIL